MDEKMARAQKVYDALCATLDSHDWKYDKKDDFTIESGAQGDDLPMDVTMRFDVKSQLFLLFSHLPFTISEDKRLDAAIAVSIVNNDLVDGCFDYDVATGHMFFRMTSSFVESEISGELMMFLMIVSFRTIDEYNDKFLMLNKGFMSVEDFISKD